MTDNNNQQPISRRKFLKTSTLAATGCAVAFGAVSVPLLRSEEVLLRPPGALDEDTFLASCIKCGQCLQVCPPQVVQLAGIGQGFGIGTPYIVPREGACILCSGLPCVLACPTGALTHDLSLGKDAQMGLAVLTNPETCLSVRGINDLVFRLGNLSNKGTFEASQAELKQILTALIDRLNIEEKKVLSAKFSLGTQPDPEALHNLKPLTASDLKWLIDFSANAGQAREACRICLSQCPIKAEQTITFVRQTDATGREHIRPRVEKTCVGCGVCEQLCPTPMASIQITPRLVWSAKQAGAHQSRSKLT